MERLRREAMVVRDSLSFRELADVSGRMASVQLLGALTCAYAVRIRVDKKMLVRRNVQNRVEVRTQFYQYHAYAMARADQPRRNLSRIDNAHGEGNLHRHVFDRNGVEVAREDILLEDMPTLDEFIRDVIRLGAR